VNRITRPLVYLLITAQLLLAVPAFAASAIASARSVATLHADAPCHGMPAQVAVDDSDKPPCCSGDAASMQDCLASCTLGAAMVMNISIAAPSAARIHAQPALPTFVALASAPPLKPPPII
jgi:hypothetical protein